MRGQAMKREAKGERSLPRPQATTRVSASYPAGLNAEFLHDSRLGTKQSPLYASLLSHIKDQSGDGFSCSCH